MLYDNAQLARLYFATYQATGQPFYMKIGEEILEYVLREMTDPSADSTPHKMPTAKGKKGSSSSGPRRRSKRSSERKQAR